MHDLDGYRPRLAITLGDPGGIGIEVVLKALADVQLRENYDVTLVGSARLLAKTYTQLKFVVDADLLVNPDEIKVLDVDIDAATEAKIILGEGNAASGAVSFAFMEHAIASTNKGDFDAIVTAPIAKSAWKAAGYHYPGQTELLAEKSGGKRVGMLFVARSPHTGWILRALLATTHIPLCQVSQALTPELMTQKLELLVDCLKTDFGMDSGTIAIAGLNPHSGEQGQLGTEEQDWLLPWLQQARQKHPNFQLEGLIPPDTMWVNPGIAWYGNSASQPADAYIALYHDQGLIPVKMMAFDRAVNTSIGLPFVRTSPDHGTAFDIAGKGVANATSIKAAIELAGFLTMQRIKARK
ncbi:4-hydroxythreonine-4-phosphate dehydrogenase PdxA [Calothrix sp. PCC 6303]|uniref:4-hydroxythreonine-4-phosphate dehydrogenase PdxA n=1 Tax=Calothrix sp. PCC 6303 TaxID=1170562 RepID=UPI0002A00ED8|nr:4-hydroxythreonine-4-phosphate dehydrogenase PdxA [Calothrix sp. PCC 6303]AFZ03865.1 4-hydroxythreonine-4-phosphate dehydrogenase [Calothrix sp. PCC 6303]